jgi:hypothetical protein
MGFTGEDLPRSPVGLSARRRIALESDVSLLGATNRLMDRHA